MDEKKKKTIKVAVSATGEGLEEDIDCKFGRCPVFIIAEIEGDEIKSAVPVENTAAMQAGGAGMTAAKIVADCEVDAVITENVGPRAFDVFMQIGIKVYHAQGKIRDALEQFIEGKLEEVSAATGPQHMGLKK